MAQQELTYQDKTNPIKIVDRTKQVTAEDLNEIKSVVNNNATDVTELLVSIEANTQKRSYPQADSDKLAGIEEGAETNPTGLEIISLLEEEGWSSDNVLSAAPDPIQIDNTVDWSALFVQIAAVANNWGGQIIDVQCAAGTYNIGANTLALLKPFNGRLRFAPAALLSAASSSQTVIFNFNAAGFFNNGNPYIGFEMHSIKCVFTAAGAAGAVRTYGNFKSQYCCYGFSAVSKESYAALLYDCVGYSYEDTFIGSSETTSIFKSSGAARVKIVNPHYVTTPMNYGLNGSGEVSVTGDSAGAITAPAGNGAIDLNAQGEAVNVDIAYLSAVSISAIGSDGATLNATFNRAGIIYYAVIPIANSVTKAEVIAGGITGSLVEGTITAVANTSVNAAFTGCDATTGYKCCVVALDDDGNDSEKKTVEFTTTGSIPTLTSVSISGTEQVGETLTGSYVGSGEDSAAYQWYAADDAIGTNEAAISEATASTYLLTASEEGKYIRLGVILTNTSGSTAEVFSAYAGAIAASGSETPFATFTTSHDGEITMTFAPGSGTLRFVRDGNSEETNAFVYTNDGSPITIEVYQNTVPDGENMNSVAFSAASLNGTMDLSFCRQNGPMAITGNEVTVLDFSDGLYDDSWSNDAIYMNGNLLASLDISDHFINDNTNLYFRSLQNLASLLLPTGVSCKSLQLYDTLLTSINIGGLSFNPGSYGEVDLDDNTDLAAITLPAAWSATMGGFSVRNCALPTAQIDALVSFLASAYNSNNPTEDVFINLLGGTNGALTNGANNTDLQAIKGYCRVNGKRLTSDLLTDSAAPTIGSATVNDGTSVTVGVTNNDANASNIMALYRPSSGGAWTVSSSSIATSATEYQFTGLTADVEYEFAFRSLLDGNTYEDSDMSASVLATPTV